MPLSESKLAEALTELYDSSAYKNANTAGEGRMSNSYKNRWKATAEVIVTYLKEALPPMNTVIYEEAAAALIEAQYNLVFLANWNSKLTEFITNLGKAAGVAMLPLYKASLFAFTNSFLHSCNFILK